MGKFDGVDGESSRGIMDLSDRAGSSSGYMKIEWTYYPGPDKLVQTVRAAHPKGINGILIGVNRVPGYHLTVGKNGIIAILIGLLLPAVQKVRAAESAEQKLLAGMLSPRGELGFAMADGSVRIATPTGERLSLTGFGKSSMDDPHDKWIDVLSTDWGN